MKVFFASLMMLFSTTIAINSFASDGLTVHTLEIGVGKFHRQDNKVHAYTSDNSWFHYIFPDNGVTDQTTAQKNVDGSYTVFYTNLEDMLAAVVSIATAENKPVTVFNIHGHGLPGAMWFPKDKTTMKSLECYSWVQTAAGSDQGNYDQYYSATTSEEIQEFRDLSNGGSFHMDCTTGLSEWSEIVGKNPAIKTVLAPDAQIHFLSCIVGLGFVGERFTQGIAQLLLSPGQGHVETSMMFGLGDWSMPEGMGFWDFQSQAQIDHDNSIYDVDRQDREIAQKGTIRLASFDGASWSTSMLEDRDVMKLSFEDNVRPGVPSATTPDSLRAFAKPRRSPMQIRIPGTNVYTTARQF